MTAEDVITLKVALSFKRIDESVELILDTLKQIGLLIIFEDQPKLESFLKTVREDGSLAALISAQAIDRLDIRFSGEIVRLDLLYRHGIEENDDLDLTLLGIVPIKTSEIHLSFYSRDVRFAKFIGFEKIEGSAVPPLYAGLYPFENHLDSSNLPTDVNLGEKATNADIIDYLE